MNVFKSNKRKMNSRYYIMLANPNQIKLLTHYKITADGDYSHEIKRHVLLGRKVMTNLDSILKS